jgi:alanine racemase
VITRNDITADEAGSILTISLKSIVSNWQILTARAAPAECGAVVKADAYGLGLEEVGAALYSAGCESFFVAHVDEGRRLRLVAPKATIFVLNGFNKAAAGSYLAARLSAVAGSQTDFRYLLDLALNGAHISYALHVDTGMNRLGFSPHEAETLIRNGAFDKLSPKMIMSHFVASEESDALVNDQQIGRFEGIREGWIERYLPIQQKHDTFVFSLSNSSGIFLESKPFYDLVRPGYALYGGNPTPGLPNPMAPVVTLQSRILQVRDIEAGDSAGYNAQWVASRPTRIATISLGYADGVLRSLLNRSGETNGGEAIVNGVRCPFAGRVSMDLITLDVTDAGPVMQGDMATIIGEGLVIDDIAERAGTNGYNILTNLGGRFHRTYVNT